MDQLAAVIVTHDHAAVLAACLESVRERAGGVGPYVVVADSGSSDDPGAVARRHGADFLPGPNAGYAAAVNRALALPRARAARHVLLLNPDVELADGTLGDLIAALEARPQVGLLGPRQVDQHGRLVPSIGRAPTPRDYWHAVRTGWSDWHWEAERYEREQRCAWLAGSCLLVRGPVLAELGGLDERFFLYSEEVDLCTRARRAGWEIAYLPEVTVMHRVADRPFDPHLERLLQWSKLLYIRKWFGPAGRASMRAALAVMFARRVWRGRRVAEPGERARARLQLNAILRFRPECYGPSSQTVSCSSGSSSPRRP